MLSPWSPFLDFSQSLFSCCSNDPSPAPLARLPPRRLYRRSHCHARRGSGNRRDGAGAGCVGNAVIELPDDVDPECRPLCEAMNRIPGIETFESCCGHGCKNFNIYFVADSLAALHALARIMHDRATRWHIIARHASGSAGLYFTLYGPVGAFDEANKIAVNIDAMEEA